MDKHTRQLAEYVQDLRPSELPAEAMEAAKVAVLDHLACGLYGAQLPWTEIARRGFPPAPTGPAVIYAREGHTSPEHAALVNGTASHGYELDDVLLATLLHPGAVIVPAALAMALETGSGGAEVLTAIALGYEAMSRVSAASGGWASSHGFHTTGTFGPVGSATAVARLLSADAGTVHNAWGFAVTMGSGVKAFQKGGGMTKRMHAGLAAARGISAARFAALGGIGPADAFAGPSGFVDVFGQGEGSPGPLDHDLGSGPLAITAAYTKPYPTCAVTHPIVAAVRTLRSRVTTPELPRRIRVGTSERGLRENSNPAPGDIMAVQYSIEYTTALGYLGVLDTFTGLTMETAARDDVRALADRVELYVDDDAEAGYPGRWGATVTLELADGRERTRAVPDMAAEQRATGRTALVRAKFDDLTRDVLGAGARKAIADIVLSLDAAGDLSELARHLTS